MSSSAAWQWGAIRSDVMPPESAKKRRILSVAPLLQVCDDSVLCLFPVSMLPHSLQLQEDLCVWLLHTTLALHPACTSALWLVVHRPDLTSQSMPLRICTEESFLLLHVETIFPPDTARTNPTHLALQSRRLKTWFLFGLGYRPRP